MKSIKSVAQAFFSALTAVTLSLSTVPSMAGATETLAYGVVSSPLPPHIRNYAYGAKASKHKTRNVVYLRSSSKKKAKTSLAKKSPAKAPVKPVELPQNCLSRMSYQALAPGVVYRSHHSSLSVNILDIDLLRADVDLKPVLAGESFNRLDEVRDQAQKVKAIAAVNANYFKHDGTPLGTLVIDGEWIAGPLYDRISMGITGDGQVHIDRLNLHGTIESSNPELGSIWVNNINQPRRTGSKLIVYTRRWGSVCRMAYSGTLVAVDNTGKVVATDSRQLTIPYGGFVLSDSKNSPVSKLSSGDLVFLQWHTRPDHWTNVIQAVSGGPQLIRNGKLYVDLQAERFKKNWTSSSIHARTAMGLTRDQHMILITVEGPHTLWDVAKALQKLGCVDAMNLDGGGSTTMVVDGAIVTRNKNSSQRRVATSLAILPKRHLEQQTPGNTYVPSTDLTSLGHRSAPDLFGSEAVTKAELADRVSNNLSVDLSKDSVIGMVGLEPDTLELSGASTTMLENERHKKSKKDRIARQPKSPRWWSRLAP